MEYKKGRESKDEEYLMDFFKWIFIYLISTGGADFYLRRTCTYMAHILNIHSYIFCGNLHYICDGRLLFFNLLNDTFFREQPIYMHKSMALVRWYAEKNEYHCIYTPQLDQRYSFVVISYDAFEKRYKQFE